MSIAPLDHPGAPLSPAAVLQGIEALTAARPTVRWTRGSITATVTYQRAVYHLMLTDGHTTHTEASRLAADAAGVCLHWLLSHEFHVPRFPAP
jgi:hypothetical protein